MLCGPFLAPGKEQRGRPEAQGAGEKEREGTTSSLKQWECAQVVHSRADWNELLPSSRLPSRKSSAILDAFKDHGVFALQID